jgi:hypothetical protein
MELDMFSKEDDAGIDIDGVNLNENFRMETRALLANRNIVPHVSPSVAFH